jgi:hypothetical protein
MAKFANALILDGGSDLLRTRAATTARIKEHLIKAYTAGDSYATVVGTNGLGSVDLVAGDIVQSSSGSNRVTTFGAKAISLTANSGASPNLHVAIVDSVTSEVLYVTDETTDQVVTSGGTFNVPAFTWTVNQPT